MSRVRRSAGVLAALVLATVVQGFVAGGTPPAAAADPPPRGARLVVATEDGQVRTYDRNGNQLGGFGTNFDSGDDVAVGNVYGGPDPEVVVAEGDDGALSVYGADGKRIPAAEKFRTAYDDSGDVLALGDIDGDALSEVLVVNSEGGRVDVLDVRTGPEPHSGFDTTFEDDGGSGFATGDVDGDGRDEVLVANRGHGGRVDVLDPRTGQAMPGFGIFDTTFEDDRKTEFAVGDVDGDGKAEVFVADADDDSGGHGRIYVISPRQGDPVDDPGVSDSTFEDTDENQFKVADVDGDGRVEALVANAEGDQGRIDVLDPRADAVLPGLPTTSFGTDALFAVSRFDLGDLDGDDIPDRVELHGIRKADGGVQLDLTDVPAQDPADPNLPANPCGKDVVVEVDWMQDTGTATPHDHLPSATGMAAVRKAFADAPIGVVADCPYGAAPADDGINLILKVAKTGIDEVTPLALPDGYARFKRDHFNAALDPYVHYAVFAHDAGDFAGRVNPGGDGQDVVITVSRCIPPAAADCVPGSSVSQGGEQEESSTFMHELGHALGLHHGGAVDDPATATDEREVNCKPNYLSIMNYFFSSGLTRRRAGGGTESFLDFSHRDLKDLKETGPVESDGIGSGANVDGIRTAWGKKGGKNANGDLLPTQDFAGGPLNWDATGGTTGSAPVDLNDNDTFGCKSGGDGETLTGFDDWAFLDRGLGVWGDDEVSAREPTSAQQAAIAEFWATSQFPDLSVKLGPTLPGYTNAVLGIAVSGQRVYATHTHRTAGQPSPADPKGRLVLLDRGTMQVLASAEVGYGPRSVAVNPVTNRVYVANAGTGLPQHYTVTVLDATTLQRIAEIPVGQAPADVAVNTRTNRVYVANPYQERIQVIDGATNTLRTPILTGPGPNGLAVDESRNTVHVALTHRPEPFVTAVGSYVDDGVHQPVALAPVPLGEPLVQPGDVAVDPTSNRLYVAGLGGGGVQPRLLVVDATARTLVKEIPLAGPARAVAVNPDAHRVFVSAQSSITVVDTVSLQIVRTMPAGTAFSIATDSGPGRLLWFGDFVDGTLKRRTYVSGTPA